jgi:uncharacterized protein (TIRG00374 family)
VRTARLSGVVLRTAVGLCAGAILTITFLRLVNVGDVFARVEHLRVGPALGCGVAFLTAYVVRAVRWRRLLAPSDVRLRRAVAIYQVAIFVNWLLPVRAGELVKSLLLRRLNGIPVSRSLATVSMDKTMDLLPAAGLLAVLPFLGLHLSRALWLLLISALAAVVLAALALVFAALERDRALAALTRLLETALPKDARPRVEPFIVRFVDTLLALVRQPRVMLVAAGYTAVAVFLDALFCLLAFRAVGVAVSLTVVFYGWTFYNLAYMIPTPPGQIGSNEVMGLLVFSGLFGVDKTGVGSMFLFSHPWTAVLMACSGLLCLTAMGMTLRGALRLARGPEDAA